MPVYKFNIVVLFFEIVNLSGCSQLVARFVRDERSQVQNPASRGFFKDSTFSFFSLWL